MGILNKIFKNREQLPDIQYDRVAWSVINYHYNESSAKEGDAGLLIDSGYRIVGNGENTKIMTDKGDLLSYDGKTLEYVNNTNKFFVPKTVIDIAPDAFSECSNLMQITAFRDVYERNPEVFNELYQRGVYVDVSRERESEVGQEREPIDFES